MQPAALPRNTLALALTLAVAGPAIAAPDASPIELDRVQVTGHRDGYGARATRSATKTDTALQDVPQAVSVITRDVIEDQGMTSLTDALRGVPGVGVAQGEGNRDTPVLRGSSTTGDLFIDGVRDDVQYIRDLYNVERVEVLKGPNAMIFGRGGAGGVVNRVMKAADGHAHRDLGLQLGSDGRRRGTFDVGGATGDASSVRVTGLYEDSSSFRDGFSLRRYGINPTATWDPAESTRLVFSYERFHDARVADRGVPSLRAFGIDRPVDVDPDMFFGDPDRSPVRATADIASVRVEHAIADGLTLRNQTRWARYDKSYQNVFANGTVARAGGGIDAVISAYSNATQRTNAFNQTDLEFKFDTGRVMHTLLAGAEFGRQETDNRRLSGVFPANRCASSRDVTNQTCVALEDGRYTGPLVFAPSATDADNHGVARVAALYVQDQIELSPQWQALVGIRHDRFEVDLRNNRTGALTSSRDDLWSPRAGLVWKPVAPLSVYASYSLAYVPRAGDQLASLSPSNAALEPEKFVNRELGAKWQATRDVMLSAALYRLDRGNVIAPDPEDSTRSILVDGQRTQGLELELSGQVTSAWRVIAGYAYQDGELTKALSATSPAGTRLAQLPRHSASLWNRVDLSPRWGVGLGATYRGATYAALPGSAPGRTDASRTALGGYVRVDGAVYLRVAPQLRLQLNVENLLDRRYFVSANSNDNVSPGSPRAAYLGITYDF
ncbi:TonB-dependent receptor [Cognatilysobacter segetis]|uniref:TonB-dependent receptor n=1 Tax=Cognatilysobacter segetis TaxID=2492394 RepID=UPI00105EDF72|nr:TonB-dependent siderophore receptor [Lysobacter segetis]